MKNEQAPGGADVEGLLIQIREPFAIGCAQMEPLRLAIHKATAGPVQNLNNWEEMRSSRQKNQKIKKAVKAKAKAKAKASGKKVPESDSDSRNIFMYDAS